MKGLNAKDAKIAVRTTEQVKENLRALAELLSRELGTKISQSQVALVLAAGKSPQKREFTC